MGPPPRREAPRREGPLPLRLRDGPRGRPDARRHGLARGRPSSSGGAEGRRREDAVGEGQPGPPRRRPHARPRARGDLRARPPGPRRSPPPAATNRVLLFVLFYIVVVLILALLLVIGRSAVAAPPRLPARRLRLALPRPRRPDARRPRPPPDRPPHPADDRPPPAERGALVPAAGDRDGRPRGARSSSSCGSARPRGSAGSPRGSPSSLAEARSEAVALALLSSAREESGLDYLELRPGDADPRARVARRRARPAGRCATCRSLRPSGSPRPARAARCGGSTPSRGAGRSGGRSSPSPRGSSSSAPTSRPTEAGPLRDLSRATSAFAQLEAERTSLQAVQVLLFLLLALLVLLAAVWVGLLLARRVTRPIAALAASVRRVGAGDFDTRVEVEGGDEIGMLGRAFNAMTDELRESRGKLVSANAELRRDLRADGRGPPPDPDDPRAPRRRRPRVRPARRARARARPSSG